MAEIFKGERDSGSPGTMNPGQDAIAAPLAPFADNRELLHSACAWADQLYRAQTQRWRHTLATDKHPDYWGMLQVNDQEINRLLNAPYRFPGELPDSLRQALSPLWKEANRHRLQLRLRLRRTARRPDLRLQTLIELFDLGELEQAALLICLLPELDARYRRLLGYLQDNATLGQPSVELLQQMLAPMLESPLTIRELVHPDSPLLRYQLLKRTSAGNAPTTGHIRIDERIAAYLLGGDQPDRRLENIVFELPGRRDWDSVHLIPELRGRLRQFAEYLGHNPGRILAQQPLPVLFCKGAYGSGGREAARLLGGQLGHRLLELEVGFALDTRPDWPQTIDTLLREASLRNAAVVFRGCETLLEKEHSAAWQYLLNALEKQGGLFILLSERAWDPSGQFHQRGFWRLEFPMANYALRLECWKRQLATTPSAREFASDDGERADGNRISQIQDGLSPNSDEHTAGNRNPQIQDRLSQDNSEHPSDHLATILANAFQLSPGQIEDAMAIARAEAVSRNPAQVEIGREDIYEGCRRQSNRGLVTYAQLIEPRTTLTFDDLILPEINRRQLHELRLRIRYRSRVFSEMGFERRLNLGKGLIAVFTGASGTGKTMAAELLGREHGMQLYKVDLSAVVSKYVGETEKNLSRVFREAEDANAILFFDEGEALFGKRGEVKEARDRWANMEVNYLLQRVEEYAGVVILTTNFRQNMDPAFLRRIQVIVDFPRPDAAARERIWAGMFPSGVPRPDASVFKLLAEKFNLVGGDIKNAVIDAAFRATHEGGGTITLRHLILGIARERQKIGTALTRADFGPEYYPWVEQEILANDNGGKP